jgi:hypothetical protein
MSTAKILRGFSADAGGHTYNKLAGLHERRGQRAPAIVHKELHAELVERFDGWMQCALVSTRSTEPCTKASFACSALLRGSDQSTCAAKPLKRAVADHGERLSRNAQSHGTHSCRARLAHEAAGVVARLCDGTVRRTGAR